MKRYPTLFLLAAASLFPLLQGCAAAAVSGAATGAAMVHDRRTAGTIIDDQATEIKSLHAITRNQPLWKQSHINVVSYNNALLLVGQTPSESFKQDAEELIRSKTNVKKIYNELSIGEPASLTTRSKDSWITTQIKAKLVGTKDISAARIKVITEEGVVYLMGLTTPQEEVTATEIARTIPNVEKVVQIFEHT